MPLGSWPDNPSIPSVPLVMAARVVKSPWIASMTFRQRVGRGEGDGLLGGCRHGGSSRSISEIPAQGEI